jgi:hypothetical protein
LYVKALDGFIIPTTGERHNGMCVIGDNGDMDDDQFDLFVGVLDSGFHLPNHDRLEEFRVKVGIKGKKGPDGIRRGITIPASYVCSMGDSAMARKYEHPPRSAKKKK